MAKRVAYLTNAALLREIHKSKVSYSEFLEPEHAAFGAIVTDLAAAPPGTVVRLMTDAHIPDGHKNRKTRGSPLNFMPFKHFLRRAEDGVLVEVGRSHWAGGWHNGAFAPNKGSISPGLALMFVKLVERISSRGNWRSYSYVDEFRSAALLQLVQTALKFDESRSSNPFAFLTTVVSNSFVRALNGEKREQAIEDALLRELGKTPTSLASQADYPTTRPYAEDNDR